MVPGHQTISLQAHLLSSIPCLTPPPAHHGENHGSLVLQKPSPGFRGGTAPPLPLVPASREIIQQCTHFPNPQPSSHQLYSFKCHRNNYWGCFTRYCTLQGLSAFCLYISSEILEFPYHGNLWLYHCGKEASLEENLVRNVYWRNF